jgi:hypothetical protein
LYRNDATDDESRSVSRVKIYWTISRNGVYTTPAVTPPSSHASTTRTTEYGYICYRHWSSICTGGFSNTGFGGGIGDTTGITTNSTTTA